MGCAPAGDKAQVGASEAQLGLALRCIAACALPAMVAMGLLFDRFGRRTLAPALLAFGATVALPALAGSPAALAALVGVLGVASGHSTSPSIRTSPSMRRSTACA